MTGQRPQTLEIAAKNQKPKALATQPQLAQDSSVRLKNKLKYNI